MGTTEIMEEERQKREGLIKRVDDWFILLDVPPGKTFYLPPGIDKIPNTVFLYFVLFFCLLIKQVRPTCFDTRLCPDSTHQLQ